MKYLFRWCCLAVLIAISACAGKPVKSDMEVTDSQISPERLAAEAEASYEKFIVSTGGRRQAATEKTAAHLKTLSGVRSVTVRGSDSLLVILEDGSELLLMLGKNRL